MASRGKQRKVGLRRIDAAIDALIPYGFSKKLITKNINKLLEVYGGDTGWAFIEDGSYRLLIETILENDDKSEMKALNPVEHQDGSYRLPIETIHANDDNSEVQEMQQVSTVGQAELGPLQPVEEMQQAPPGGSSAGFTEASEIFCHPQPAKVNKGERITRSPGHIRKYSGRPRRPPYYGWLSESEDEVQERNRKKLCKTRWDVVAQK